MARARNDSPLAGTAPSAGGEVSKLSIAMFLFRTTLFRTLVPQSTRLCQYCDIVGMFRNGEIATSILVSEATVRNCLGSIFKKVGVTNRVQLMLFAIREGFVNLPAAGDSTISPREVLRLATSAGRLLGNKRTRESAT